ncbi:AAA family ATPase [Stenotrophomonas acidaminiphila]|uniref:UvrD-helicase domain-containing protein n=1 Tax=Stenotrophomonas acidaminiphila TaxID=128780 RepID=UPI002ABE507F|nr:UvrD-helicase domain-containing protein [Stenotrophomonas acidaminiphila]WPU55887.1 AAA family ATPase [Stenotrophomonas acidaminiphila]
MSIAPRVALSQEFLLKLGKLPSAVHARIVKWALKFQQDPMSLGINYETIKAARDPNLRSVRIDQDWRGIVFKPDKGDLYILLHVDHHDEAYRWAERRKMAVNPVTGALQLVSLEAVEALESEPVVVEAVAREARGESLFESLSDEALVQLGTPIELLPLVRRVRNEPELDAIQAQLPVEAYEGLFLVAAGDSVSQVLHERETRVDRPCDDSDYSAALDSAESQSRFVVVTSDAEMTAILNAPLAQWRVFLHPVQRKLAVGDRSGPVRILGGAGTGKTVLALHRAKWLAKNRTAEGQKVLFTTFTRNLALDVEQNLKSLFLDDPDLAKVEVCNLDRWVYRFLRQRNYEHKIIYKRDSEAWERALQVASPQAGLDEVFYADEWDQVIAAQGVQSLDEYRRASRVGRQSILSRSKRDLVWPVFEEYRAQLSAKRMKDVDDAYRDAALLLAKETGSSYSAIVVDETQDFGPQALRLMRAMVPPGSNDLFFVGDGHQRIYSKHKAVLGRCGIDIRGRSRKLYLNYRTTDEIRRVAVALLEGREIDDLDGGSDDNRRYKSLSHGPMPELLESSSADEAIELAAARVANWMAEADIPSTVCVMAPTTRLRDDVARTLNRKGISTTTIDADSIDSAESSAVRVSTMHRAKGLEFDRVAVIALGEVAEHDLAHLVYVSLTRAKIMALLVVPAPEPFGELQG